MTIKPTYIFVAIACMCLNALSTLASDSASRVVLRQEVSRSHREELIARLRVITGRQNLSFDDNGSLRLGDKQTTGGSQTARALLAAALAGQT